MIKAVWEFFVSLVQLAWYLVLIAAGIGLLGCLIALGAQKGGL